MKEGWVIDENGPSWAEKKLPCGHEWEDLVPKPYATEAELGPPVMEGEESGIPYYCKKCLENKNVPSTGSNV